MKLTVVKEFTFEAAHYLPDYKGPCANLHGHTYRLQVGVKGELNKETGMVIDFSKLKQNIESMIIKYLDHAYLNNLRFIDNDLGFPFPWRMPTAEHILQWIYFQLQSIQHKIDPDQHIYFVFIRLYETPTSYVEWRGHEDH